MNFGHVLLFALLDTDVCKWGNITAFMSQQLKQNRFAEFSKSRQLYAGADTQIHFGGHFMLHCLFCHAQCLF